eukprot:10670510-Ditylum_brightwellii.AAC.2
MDTPLHKKLEYCFSFRSVPDPPRAQSCIAKMGAMKYGSVESWRDEDRSSFHNSEPVHVLGSKRRKSLIDFISALFGAKEGSGIIPLSIAEMILKNRLKIEIQRLMLYPCSRFLARALLKPAVYHTDIDLLHKKEKEQQEFPSTYS